MHLGNLFLRSVSLYGGRPALACGDEPPVSYAGLGLRVQALAQLLRIEYGLNPGDRVCLAMKNSTAYAEAMWACWLARLCVVPVNSKLHPREVHYILEDAQARLCLSQGEFLAQLRQVEGAPAVAWLDVDDAVWRHPAQAVPDPVLPGQAGQAQELAWLFYTSGTTGRPKGVMLSHANLSAMALNFHADMLSIGHEDVLIHVAPMSHGSGLYGIAYVMRGGLQVVSPSGGFDEAELAGLLQTYSRASLFAAPTIINRMTRHVRDKGLALPGLRAFLVGGAPFYAEDIRQAVAAFGPRVAQMYGQGETPMTISALGAEALAQAVAQQDSETLASVGYAQTGVDLRIVDAAGCDVPPGEPGEIVVYGDTVMQGYWRNPAATQRTLIDGGLYTGDIGCLDALGRLHLKDRSKDVIISGGSNIYPREVEDALLQHPAVREVAVIGVPDADWGEIVTAVVVRAAPVVEADLDRACNAQIARFKRPKRYLWVEELPKNPTGKVLKPALRELAARLS